MRGRAPVRVGAAGRRSPRPADTPRLLLPRSSRLGVPEGVSGPCRPPSAEASPGRHARLADLPHGSRVSPPRPQERPRPGRSCRRPSRGPRDGRAGRTRPVRGGACNGCPMTETSVLINTYNHAPYIRECVDSALSQTLRPGEVIVYDDGSSDGTVEILRGYGDRITLIEGKRLQRPPHISQANAIQAAFAASTGNLIFLLDGDDRFK